MKDLPRWIRKDVERKDVNNVESLNEESLHTLLVDVDGIINS